MLGTELYDSIREILPMIDRETLPETYNYLDSFVSTERGMMPPDPYQMATDLMLCDNGMDFPEILTVFIEELYERSYRSGNPDAINDLGACYYSGDKGFPQDYTKALECYHNAAESGSRLAQENLGYCYYYGRDTEVDYEKAFHYFALGAFDGHLISLYKIGDMYYNGYYVNRNEREAFCIYQHCLDTMTDEAAPIVAGPVFLRLGDCLLNGKGTEADAEAALSCYQRAELYLYDMVTGPDAMHGMYKKSLDAAIAGQEKARAKMRERID